MYAKELDIPNYVSEYGRQSPYPSWLSMGKLWALAQYFDCTGLQDATIDAMLHKMRDHPEVAITPDSLVVIFNITPEDSTIQRLFLEFSAARFPEAQFQRRTAKLPLALIKFLAAKFLAEKFSPISGTYARQAL